MSEEFDPRESELGEARPRSRKAFRWMPGPVLWHNVPQVVRAPRTAFGRNLYARKLRESGGEELSPRAQSELMRWQAPLAYLVILRGGRWLFTWHAPWCRRCDCPGAGWAFSRSRGYWSGLGFELSYAPDQSAQER